MRKKPQRFLFLLAMLAFLAIKPAQAQQTMRISMSDGTVMDIAVADIRKLTFDLEVGMQQHPALVKQLLKLKVYPNPVKGQAAIDYTLHAEGAVLMEIFNMQGLRIEKTDLGFQQPGEYHHRINTLLLPSGSYICRIRQNREVVCEKMIVNH